ncbi:MAG: dual specificity protein phosphatase family protein [Planctomycetes bacterium]|nr:dual specificity protein phosphatase family protein [Planctomycetota bacterium]
MKQIIPHCLWIGHAGDGRDFKQVHQAGIRAIVQLAIEEPPLACPRELIYCRFPLVDGSGNDNNLLLLAVHTLAKLLENRISTLVICGGGISRSPAISAAALAMAFNLTPADAIATVNSHAGLDVSPGLWRDLQLVVKQPIEGSS